MRQYNEYESIQEFNMEFLFTPHAQESSFPVNKNLIKNFLVLSKYFFIDCCASVVLSATMQYLEPAITSTTPQHKLVPGDFKRLTSL